MIVQDSVDCKLEFDEGLQCLIQQWKGYTNSKDFRETIAASLEFFKKNPSVNSIISDSRAHKVVVKEDSDWVTNEINPQLVQNGLRKIAFVMPENVVAKISVKDYERKTDSPIQIGHFVSLQEAKDWIAAH